MTMAMTKFNGKTEKEIYYACTPHNKKFEVVNPLGDKLKVKGKKIEVEVIDDSDGFTYLVYKNKKYQVEILEKSQNKYTIMINGVWYNFSIETPISYKRRKTLNKSGTATKVENVQAPMPGKILDIQVEENSEVKVGESLVILEAMKMQNEIISSVNGVVKKINVKTNENVMKDDIMIEILKS